MNFKFSQNSPPSHLANLWHTAKLGHVQNPPNSKISCTKTFMVFIWGHLEAIPTFTSQNPQISLFSQKHPTKQSSYVMPHHQSWPCAKHTQLKTFVHQDFQVIYLGTFGRHSNPHISKSMNFNFIISKSMNFNFIQNFPPSHLGKPWHTATLGHVKNPHNSKLLWHSFG